MCALHVLTFIAYLIVGCVKRTFRVGYLVQGILVEIIRRMIFQQDIFDDVTSPMVRHDLKIKNKISCNNWLRWNIIMNNITKTVDT